MRKLSWRRLRPAVVVLGAGAAISLGVTLTAVAGEPHSANAGRHRSQCVQSSARGCASRHGGRVQRSSRRRHGHHGHHGRRGHGHPHSTSHRLSRSVAGTRPAAGAPTAPAPGSGTQTPAVSGSSAPAASGASAPASSAGQSGAAQGGVALGSGSGPRESSKEAGSGAVAGPSTSTGGNLPTVTEIPATSGSHGYPYDAVPETPLVPGAPSINLQNQGYAQREFKLSGGANIYRQSSTWRVNGEWGVAVSQPNVPYTTRMIVRYPTDPAKFNGTVVFEWLNDTTGGDQDPVWSELYPLLIKHGYAYVGVTAQKPGMEDLRVWDPSRYGALGDSNDGQSYEIFTQAAEAVKADSATILGGLTPKTLIGAGDSQSAFRVDTYVNAIQPIKHVFNGFLAVGRAIAAAPIGEGLLSFSPILALIREDNTAPLIQLNTQGDIEELDAAAARQPDNAYLRTWELPGASHIDAHESEYEIETLARERPEQPIPSCIEGTPISGTGTALDGHTQPDNMPLFQVEQAAMADLNRWVTEGVPPPHSPRISTTGLFFNLFDLVNKNRYGVGYGGIRVPDAEVPTEEYSAINLFRPSSTFLQPWTLMELVRAAFQAFQTGGITNEELRAAGLCLLSGYFKDLSQSTLASMYPTPASYTSKIAAVANADAAAGFLTPEGAEREITRAEAGVGPLQDPPLTWPME
jgi:hypothetical protein